MLRNNASLPLAFRIGLAFSLAALAAAPSSITAQEAKQPKQAEAKEKSSADAKKEKDEAPRVVTTRHTATIGGAELRYAATAGSLQMLDDKGKERATIFYVAYRKLDDDGGHPAPRPITFAFNGGPGSSSVWLHLGLMGPKRVDMGERPVTPPPPYRAVPNEYSLLDLTDIVMIDPVSTGLSRPAEDVPKKEFHGYFEDLHSVGDFIERFVTTHDRWASPKFILGESYGTTRAAGLAGYLQDRHRMYLNGIVMVSSVLNFQTIRFRTGNDLPYVLFLPSYTATAWYHKRLPKGLQRDLPATLRKAEKFALGDYQRALQLGSRMPADKRKQVAEQMARLTALSAAFIERSNLRVSMPAFSKELLRDARRTTGRLDSRFLGIDRDAAGDRYEYDPSDAAISGAFAASLNDYLRNDLKYRDERRYEIFGAVDPWNYESFTNRFVDTTDSLRGAISKNPALKVFVASGYYDLATPYFASDYTYANLQLDEKLQDNITMGYYEAGHMMYIHKPSLVKFKQDMAKFYAAALAGE